MMKKLLCALLVLVACLFLMACEDNTPYIGENGNWWIGEEDLGVQAQGPQGEKGETGEKGDKGNRGPSGDDGESVTVTDVKVISDGITDTYTIYFSDGTTTTLTVTNGEDGEKGDKGDKGNPGYNGDTPYIGKNGNWWVGNKDTGVLADYSQEGKKISDGLEFETITKNGVAGMIVTDYQGTDTDVVIPSYVGAVPVIAIAREAFEDNDEITSVLFSKNTVYLEEYAFNGCDSLSSVDFNGAQIEKIPSYAFRNTALKSVELPEQTTYLGDYAFSGTYLSKINYENIVYFGSYCLNKYFGHGGDYVYLTSDVEYVGSYAFEGVFVFAEHASKPTAWSSSPAGSGEWEVVTYGCKRNEDYIYSVNEASATVHYYIGDEKRIEIPQKIETYDVTRIGYGFGSMGYNRYAYYIDLADDEIITPSEVVSALTILEAVKIPNGVSEIDYGTFFGIGTMIFVPETVTKMSRLDGFENEEIPIYQYYAFEDNEYPAFYEGFIANDSIASSTTWIESYRTALDVPFDKVKYNPKNKCYYYDELIGYSLLASMDYTSENLVISSTFDGSKVHTIRTNAIVGLEIVRTIKLEDGITKIQGKAFRYLDNIIFIYIPDSVTVINAYGFNGVDCDYYLIEASSKPSEWDSYWNSNSSASIQYSVDYSNVEDIEANDNFIYFTSSNEATLIKYIGSSSTIKIPRVLDGKTVTTIKTGFLSSSGIRYLYIPSSVTKIESKAITNTSTSTFYFYCEASSQPSTWASDFYYNSYYSSSTRYVTFSWDKELDY